MDTVIWKFFSAGLAKNAVRSMLRSLFPACGRKIIPPQTFTLETFNIRRPGDETPHTWQERKDGGAECRKPFIMRHAKINELLLNCGFALDFEFPENINN